MKIVLDCFGGDNAPLEAVAGGMAALQESSDLILVLSGDEEKIKKIITENFGEIQERLEFLNVTEVVENEDDPVSAVRKKKDSSLVVGLNAVSEGNGDAFVSAGNTGAVFTGATLIIKRIRGIKRGAIAPLIPTLKGKAVVIDMGANAECKSEYYPQFALMGSFYAKHAMGLSSPKVGLLNNGAEEHKGDELRREAHKLLTDAHNKNEINFVGNIEGRDGPLGKVDVIVADGFSGNIYLKTMEGIGLFFTRELKAIFMSSFVGKLSGLLLNKAIGSFKKKVDYNNAGGAPLLGIRKPVIKAHGSAKAVAICNCILQAKQYAESGIVEEIGKSLKKEENGDE